MSRFRDPIGPEDRKVYMRRRWMALAGLVAVVAIIAVLILFVWVRPGSSGGPQEAAKISTTTEESGLVDSEATPSPDEIPACAAGQLTVTPITDETSYASGVSPQLSLEVENTGSEACQADLGTAGMVFTISSGDDEVWRSTDCQETPEQLPTILDPGKPLSSDAISWDRTRSSPETCEIARDPVTAGGASYHLRVSVGGVQSSSTAQFLLY